MIQIVEKPYLYPQRCYFTGDASERPILDTGVNDIEGGRVYIALHFLDEICRVAGYVTRDESLNLQAELETYKRRADAVPAILERATDGIRVLAADLQLDLLRLADPRHVEGVDDPVDAPEGGAGELAEAPAAAREQGHRHL